MTINCRGTLVDLSVPKVMGILNLTPDSFYDGGKYKNESAILNQAEKMLEEGTTFIDLGAYSSRPGANHVPEEEEKQRILPVLELLLRHFPNAFFSIDTFRSSVAHACLDMGAAIINDISAGNLDPKMFDVVSEFQVPYILMHLKGTPQSMQEKAIYDNVISDLLQYFAEKIDHAHSKKINDIIIDPGFGFAKTVEQNYHVLAHLDLFQTLNKPLLIGLSRKSMIYKTLKSSAAEALNGSSVLHSVALLKGAHILRVHDVKEAMECISLLQMLKQNA